MKLKVLIIIIAVGLPHLIFAQGNNARQKIEAARIALITERLGLSPEQAEKFWPVYNEYEQKRRELTRELQQERGNVNINNMSEEESRQLMNKALEIKERQLQLEKRYTKRLSELISPQQMLRLRKAEEDFRRMILRRLEERKRQQMRREQLRRQREGVMRNWRDN